MKKLQWINRRGGDVFTMDALMELQKKLPPLPQFFYCAAKPELCCALRASLDSHGMRSSIGADWRGMSAIHVYEKPNQLADVWLFSDAKTLRDYLSGVLNESDLVAMVANGNVKSAP